MATVANTITSLIPKILARSMPVLRERCVMPRVVFSDFANETRKFGSTIDIEIPSAVAVSDVTPAEEFPIPPPTVPTVATVSLSNWRKANFHLSDQDMTKIDTQNQFIPGQLNEALRALANDVNSKILGHYNDVWGYTGTAALTPFGSGVAILSATNCVKVLNSQLAPISPRYGVLDWTAYSAALALSEFRDAEKRGNAVTQTTGDIGFVTGINWFGDDAVPYHTCGTIDNGAGGKIAKVNDAAYTVGEITVDIDNTTLTGTLVKGDIFTVAGDTQTYVKTGITQTAGANAIAAVTFLPASKVAWADDALITVVGSHRCNLIFHRDAFAFANRPLADDALLGSPNIQTMQDPVTGMIIRLEVIREHKQTVWELDILYGSECIDPRKAMILAG